MYIPLFHIRYQHEFFGGSPLFDMDCSWPCEVDKLIRNMGLVAVPQSGRIQFMLDSTSIEREGGVHGRTTNAEEYENFFMKQFLDLWGEDRLTFYLTPKDSTQFHNITGELGALGSDLESFGCDGKPVIQERFFKFIYFNSNQSVSNNSIDLSSTVLDKVSGVSEISDHMGSIEKSIRKNATNIDLKRLKKMVNNKAIFVVCVGMQELKNDFVSEKKNPWVTLEFSAAKTHYKYYFTSIEPDKYLDIVYEGKNEPSEVTYSQVSEQHGNQRVCTFISNQPICLRWHHDKHFKLVRNVIGGPQTVISKLPHPSPEHYYKHTFPNQPPIKVLEAFIN